MSRQRVERSKAAPKGSANGPPPPTPAAVPERRAPSNILSLFSQSQIQELKEAFTMMDANRDGFIDVADLKEIHNSLGKSPSDEDCKKMLAECPGQLNFTAFLTLFGEKLHGTDPESTMRDAFKMFDKEDKGFLAEDYLRDMLKNVGDQFTDAEMKQVWKEAPISGGKFDYQKFVTLVKRGPEEE